MNELALFAGAGGGLLASKLLGWRTVCGVELDQYSRLLLARRQNEGHIEPFPIWDDIRTFDGKPWISSVDIVTGGFPCQAFSTAAHGKNTAVDLWPEMLRVVCECEAPIVFAENVSRRAIQKAAYDLAYRGYKTAFTELSAKDLGADHVRSRWWLLAYANDEGELLRRLNAEMGELPQVQASLWEGDPGISGISDGLAHRVDRLRTTGNGQVPAVAATAFRILSEGL